ncbi:proline dehydrogenase [Ascosphaera aggregata]|nr:proline dehydrogenase [Ascosphaera aggregata]
MHLRTPRNLPGKSVAMRGLYLTIIRPEHGLYQMLSTGQWRLQSVSYHSQASHSEPTPPEPLPVSSTYSNTVSPISRPDLLTVPSPSVKSPLSVLPVSSIVRSLFITTISSYPRLLDLSLGVLKLVTKTKYVIFDAERNPVIRGVMGATVYNQFCAGRTLEEIDHTIQGLKDKGFAGVILGFAREVVLDEDKAKDTNKVVIKEGETPREISEITAWKDSQLKTINLAGHGNIVHMKWTGAGRLSLERLLKGLPPPPTLAEANDELCMLARKNGVSLFIDAEQQAIQKTIDAWVVDLMRKWNKPGLPALVYNTYQAYLRSVPSTVSEHLHLAKSEGWVLGVKLVRGAYLNSDPRHLIWATKEETNASYDGIAEALITQSYNDFVQAREAAAATARKGTESTSLSGGDIFPEVNLVLASHNRHSVTKAQMLRNDQLRSGRKMIRMAYGQLYGMADDISCALIHGDAKTQEQAQAGFEVERSRVFKAVIWGTMQDCSDYLLRRGYENRDAASRTADTRNAMAAELKRRIFSNHNGILRDLMIT